MSEAGSEEQRRVIGPVLDAQVMKPELPSKPIGPQVAKPGETGPEKTPVSKLYELANVMGLDIDFQVVKEEGWPHSKMFTVKVTVGDIATGEGKGSNKKLAKHEASKEALTMLMETPTFHSYLQGKRKGVSSPLDNYVGKLLESTTKRGMIKPSYNFTKEEGPPHNRHFEVECILGALRCTGMGRTKKESKRNAAKAMLDQISKSNLSFQTPAKRMMFVPPSSANQTLSCVTPSSSLPQK